MENNKIYNGNIIRRRHRKKLLRRHQPVAPNK